MKWYKKAGFLLVAGASLLGLVACGQNNQSTDGKVTIEFFNQKTEMADTLQKIVDDFEKEHPNIDVKHDTFLIFKIIPCSLIRSSQISYARDG